MPIKDRGEWYQVLLYVDVWSCLRKKQAARRGTAAREKRRKPFLAFVLFVFSIFCVCVVCFVFSIFCVCVVRVVCFVV